MEERLVNPIEKRFMTTYVYKRSRRYFDIFRLNQIQQKQEQSRRTPFTTIQSRLDDHFCSTDDKLNKKVKKQLSYMQKRLWREQKQQEETNYTQTKKISKVLDMDKMITRSKDVHKAVYFNESQFNNFNPHQPQPKATLDFNKFINRNSDLIHKKRLNEKMELMKEIDSFSTGKTKEELLFNQSIFRCYVNYDKNRKQSPKRQTIDVVKNLQKIHRGQKLTRKKDPSVMCQFYNDRGRHSPSHFDRILLKNNQNYWEYGQKSKEENDFDTRKRKEDQKEKRLTLLKDRKHLQDVRGEMCDEKYFKRNG